jgi:hypothetical protein
MNMITIALIMIVVLVAVGIGAALIWFLRSIKQPSDMNNGGSMSSRDREQHIDTLLKDFEGQLDQAGDQDDWENKP